MTAYSGADLAGLTAALMEGSDLAFEEIFRLYREKLYAYFIHKTATSEDALDLVQNSFAKLWQYRNSLSRDFLLEQQLFHIARTVYIDHLRRQNKQLKIRRVLTEYPFAGNCDAQSALAFENRDQLQQALRSLPDLRRKVLYLNRVEGYSYREIAAILSITVKSTDNNLAKALRHLKKLIALGLVCTVSFFP